MKAFVSFLFIGAIIGLGVMLGRGTPASSPSVDPVSDLASPVYAGNLPETKSTTLPTVSPSASAAKNQSPAQGGSWSGRLFAVTSNGGATEIVSIDVTTKERKLLFSDKSSQAKIQAVSPATAKGDTLLIVLGQTGEPSGQLVSLRTDGSAKTSVISDGFVGLGAPALSPDQTKMATVSFANTDQEFGFRLAIQDVTGANKKELASDDEGIANLHFSPDGKRIAFIKGSAIGTKSVSVVTIATGKVETLYSAGDRTVQDLNWGSSGLLTVVTASPDDRTGQTTDVFLIDPKNSSSIQLTKDEATEHAAVSAPDGSGVAYIKVKTNKTQPGDLNVVLPNGSGMVTLTSATDILGWVR